MKQVLSVLVLFLYVSLNAQLPDPKPQKGKSIFLETGGPLVGSQLIMICGLPGSNMGLGHA